MKERLAMVTIESDDNLFIKVSDLITIRKVPDVIKNVIVKYMPDIKKMDNGLPAAGFIGKSGVKITGIFKYGELGFISYIGKEEKLVGQSLVHLFSNIDDKSYETMKEYAEKKLKEISEVEKTEEGRIEDCNKSLEGEKDNGNKCTEEIR